MKLTQRLVGLIAVPIASGDKLTILLQDADELQVILRWPLLHLHDFRQDTATLGTIRRRNFIEMDVVTAPTDLPDVLTFQCRQNLRAVSGQNELNIGKSAPKLV